MALSLVEIVRPAAHPRVRFQFCTYEFTKNTIYLYYNYS